MNIYTNFIIFFKCLGIQNPCLTLFNPVLTVFNPYLYILKNYLAIFGHFLAIFGHFLEKKIIFCPKSPQNGQCIPQYVQRWIIFGQSWIKAGQSSIKPAFFGFMCRTVRSHLDPTGFSMRLTLSMPILFSTIGSTSSSLVSQAIVVPYVKEISSRYWQKQPYNSIGNLLVSQLMSLSV